MTAAGIQKGEFEVIAVHNHITKTVYWVPEPTTVPEIIYIVVGVITLMFHKFGLILIVGAILFMVNKNKKIVLIREARAMAQKVSAPSVKNA